VRVAIQTPENGCLQFHYISLCSRKTIPQSMMYESKLSTEARVCNLLHRCQYNPSMVRYMIENLESTRLILPIFGCALEEKCLGGCKAAAEACFGDISAMDPFLSAYHSRARKIAPAS
jgi:hypothetical protein